jgi:lysophospholipase L1-like esterase
LQIGANDILQKRPLLTVLEDLRAVIDTLAPHTNKIVMISSSNIGGAVRFKNDDKAVYYQEQSINFKEAFKALQNDHPHFTFVDLYVTPEKDPFVLEPHIYTANDGLHPTNAGYAIWYNTLKPVLRAALEE